MQQKFSKNTLDFLVKAGKQKNPKWLENNLEEYEAVLRGPFIALAEQVKFALQPLARDYHFPSKGLARIKRPDFKVAGGQSQYKDWISMIASRPSKSRFESHPHLFFGLFPNEDHKILIAGGLWQPTSQQTRLIRQAISADSKPFHQLFSDRQFKACFKNGFRMEDFSSRTPRGFSENHKDIAWIKLKKFVVYKVISVKDFSSPKFGDAVVKDFKQALRLNSLLDQCLKAQWPHR
jgi:uncharacterized protein (TIGR02453 family)